MSNITSRPLQGNNPSSFNSLTKKGLPSLQKRTPTSQEVTHLLAYLESTFQCSKRWPYVGKGVVRRLNALQREFIELLRAESEGDSK